MNIEGQIKSADRYGDLDVVPASIAIRMHTRMLVMERAIVSIGNVIAESNGVVGMLGNMGITTWESLKQDWLRDYVSAIRFLAEQNDVT